MTPRPARRLTFAHVASATALVVALGGGGAAVAAGLAKNSVGSPQLKAGAVTSSDIKNNAVTGKKVKESSLGEVPAAGRARTVDTVQTVRVTASAGATRTMATRGSLKVMLTCVETNANEYRADVEIVTTADNAMMDANLMGDEESDFDVVTGPAQIVSAGGSTTSDIEDGGFAAITATGVSWKGYGMAMVHVGGAHCAGEMTFLG